jgi:hypothetical protein
MPPGLYATEPHQPTYRPPQPPVEVDRGSLLDLRPPRPRTRRGAAGRSDAQYDDAQYDGAVYDGALYDDADDADGPGGWPRAVVAAAGLAVLVLLAAATILAAFLLHDGRHHATAATGSTSATAAQPTSPSPALPRSAARVAASWIDTAMTRSVAARKLIGPANTRTRACRATSADVTALNTAATTRAELVTGLRGLNVRALTGGAAVVADLRQAWTYSARADAAYATWARHHLSCSGHAATRGNNDWDRAHHNDALSSAAKARAVKHWNPLARRYHLAARAAGAI